MLAADADLEVGARLAALLGRHLDQLADAFLIERGERILLEDSLLHVRRAGTCRCRRARMPKVVWVRSLVPKLKNSASCGDLIGDQSGARQLDHGSDQVVDAVASFSAKTSSATRRTIVGLVRHLLDVPTSGIMISGFDLDALLLATCNGGFEDGARLHLGDLRDR